MVISAYCVELLHEIPETLSQLPLVSQRIVSVEVSLESPAEEDPHEWDGVGQALHATVHEARIPQVAQPRSSWPHSCGLLSIAGILRAARHTQKHGDYAVRVGIHTGLLSLGNDHICHCNLVSLHADKAQSRPSSA